ncbi:bL21 family ribosomal protein [Candidatus Karelsulcia muelleri]|uniref:bL21 family ribosomal protein n=1 Tax=Candidatus Karelsulcia muelleri TaxID=336810 RepID=UPI002368D685|nr:bL21 family ribosomal protein [Candidatus Karelsulcia muelleri]WDI79545.1 bL21 family ribosomal protein [Candidatus Karelsulcia muelleri]
MFYFLMKAYFEALGKQYCAKPYKYIDIPFIKILLFSNKEKFNIGNPYLKNLYILAKVISHYKEKKKKKRLQTKIKILSIVKINGTQKGSRNF